MLLHLPELVANGFVDMIKKTSKTNPKNDIVSTCAEEWCGLLSQMLF